MWGDICKNGRCNAVAVFWRVHRGTAVEQAAIRSAELDIIQHALVRGRVNYRAGEEVLCGIAGLDGGNTLAQTVTEYVIHGIFDDGTRAGRALLAVKAEGGGGDTLDGSVHIRVGGDNDGVFATHL